MSATGQDALGSHVLRQIPREKLYFSIANRILDGIRSGVFLAGKALPSERVLATRLGVSRTSVREAILVLEHAGVVEARMGSGTFVLDGGSLKAARLRLVAAERGEFSPLDIAAARRVLEPATAELAAQHATPADLETLREFVEEQAERVAKGLNPDDPDLGFHAAVGRATHNAVLENLVIQIVEMMRQRFWSDIKATQPTAKRYLAEHQAIYARIEARDGRGASRMMLRHIDGIETWLLGEIS